ncbi:MAG: NUDIX domain-containing protein [Dehalococcoidia bacterium]
MGPRFCPQCATPLRRRRAFGRRRLVCAQCGFVHFNDPKVAVGVVAQRRGRLLLVKRNHEPHLGEWSFPSGFIDAGEPLEEGAVRETKEETGLDARIDGLIGAYSRAGERVIFIAYAARVVGGRIEVGAECQDVRFFAPDALPPLAFPHDPAIVRAWQESRYRR